MCKCVSILMKCLMILKKPIRVLVYFLAPNLEGKSVIELVRKKQNAQYKVLQCDWQ